MLDPKHSRFDYGTYLQPPQGYELDSAIATTYSLELDALLAIPVAICFHDTLEGDLRGEKLALLEAIGQLKGRLKVFYQAGKIKLPHHYNRLFALLEPCLQPILPEGGVFSSFHPKLWLLRYIPKESGPICYRLLVLSRNLTFDRSWDIAVSLDGVLTDEPQVSAAGDNWFDFIDHLMGQAGPFEAKAQFKAELHRISWKAPEGFRDPRLIAGGSSFGPPVRFLRPNDSLTVVSPFLKNGAGQVLALDDLAKLCPEGKLRLFSRSEELDSVGAEKLEAWTCYSINGDVVDGEERLQISDKKQNLHAKLIITERGKTTHWHLGSANATSAALGDASGKDPRNTEFMLRLTGRTQQVGASVLMDQWLGEKGEGGLFVPHTFNAVDSDEGEDFRNSVRHTVYQLIKAQWQLEAALDDQGTYSLRLTHTDPLEVSPELQIKIGQLAIKNAYKPLMPTLEWRGMSLNQISALLPIRIFAREDALEKQLLEQLVIQVRLKLPSNTHREQNILSQMIDSEGKFLNYIRLLLQQQPDKNEWLGYEDSGEHSEGLHLLFDDSPLFEQLMEAAARHPESLKRISKLLKRLEDTGVQIPESFKRLWPHFERTIK